LSLDRRYAFHTSSTFDTPPVTELIQLPEHKIIRVLEDNSQLRARIKALKIRPAEFLKIDIGNGLVMDAWMIKPGDFDPSKSTRFLSGSTENLILRQFLTSGRGSRYVSSGYC
jgi:hypothetical protein